MARKNMRDAGYLPDGLPHGARLAAEPREAVGRQARVRGRKPVTRNPCLAGRPACQMAGRQALPAKGLTLIEMVAMIVVLGIAIPPLLTNWADIAWRSARSESLADASFYAQELMEEIKSKRYDENGSAPWTPSTSFSATDPGESKANSATFDDIDDFVGCTDPLVTAPVTGYSRLANIDYVRLNGSAWQGCVAGPCNSTNCTLCNACCYKRITVTVSRTDNIGGSASLTTIVSTH